MPFDPTSPVNNTLITATELRAQFTSLKELIDTLTTQVGDLQTQVVDLTMQVGGLQDQMSNAFASIDNIPSLIEAGIATTPSSVNGLETIAMAISNPPSKPEVEALRDKLNDLIAGLHR